jgi:hypothetical protein
MNAVYLIKKEKLVFTNSIVKLYYQSKLFLFPNILFKIEKLNIKILKIKGLKLHFKPKLYKSKLNYFFSTKK